MANKWLHQALPSQRKWIADHGQDLSGYIDRYGDPDLHFCHGDGGTAIYHADLAELHRIQKRLGLPTSRA